MRRKSAAVERDVRAGVFLRAEPRRVYKALTCARELRRFWLKDARARVRNGARVRMAGPRCAPKGARASAVFADLDPGKKVAWLFDERDFFGTRKAPALVSVFLEERGRGTQATLVHAGFPSRRARAQDEDLYGFFQRLWEDLFVNLRRYLEANRA